MEDASLISACIAGEKGAWDIFVSRFSRLIYWSASKTLANSYFKDREDLIEDIFQEIFERLLEKEELKKLRDSDGIRKFLCVLACHAAMDKIKILSRYEKTTLKSDITFEESDPEKPLYFSDVIPDEGKNPSETILYKESQVILSRLLTKLPPKDRTCLEMHYLDGLTHKEIAETLGFPQDTVSTIIRRAKDTLRQGLQRKGLGK
jgi:RNA polymerase sigma factor (sigma-70 family)